MTTGGKREGGNKPVGWGEGALTHLGKAGTVNAEQHWQEKLNRTKLHIRDRALTIFQFA